MKSTACNMSPSWWAPAGRGPWPATRPTRKATACPTSPACSSTRWEARRRFPGRRPLPAGSWLRRPPRPRRRPSRAGKPYSGRTAGRCHGRRARRTSAFFRICATARCSVRARPGPASSSAGSCGERHGLVCVSGRRGRRGSHSRLRHRAGACRASVAGRARAVRICRRPWCSRLGLSRISFKGAIRR